MNVQSKLVVANWKMYGSSDAVTEMLKHCANQSAMNVSSVILALPAIYLAQAQQLIKLLKADFKLASQDISKFADYGAFTGEISNAMLKEFNIPYVIIGHSERRELVNETDDILLAKLNNAVNCGIVPIFCIGESLALRENRSYQSHLLKQLQLLRKITAPLTQLIIAYEPVWSIGSGVLPNAKQINEVMQLIQQFMQSNLAHVKMTPLYGGSVSAQTAGDILHVPAIGGVLVGSASLKIDEFTKIVAAQ